MSEMKSLFVTVVVVIAMSVAMVSVVCLDNIEETWINCPHTDPLTGLTIPAVVDCHIDCIEQHNSTDGYCDENENCICNFAGGQPLQQCFYKFTSLGVPVPIICQCVHRETPFVQAFWQSACEVDCQCEHGAFGGDCDWEAKQCICHYPTGFVFDKTRIDCLTAAIVNVTTCTAVAAATGQIPPGC